MSAILLLVTVLIWIVRQTMGDPIINSIGMKMVLIPPGEFQMGSPDSDSYAFSNEKPQHLVKITTPFYLSVHEVTQQQYEKVMGTRPWQGNEFVKEGSDNAATYVSHDDAVAFCRPAWPCRHWRRGRGAAPPRRHAL